MRFAVLAASSAKTWSSLAGLDAEGALCTNLGNEPRSERVQRHAAFLQKKVLNPAGATEAKRQLKRSDRL
ncbi:MAG TPA: hypothetical protein DEQ68_05235 [Ruminococcaceae bacterium]|nr:hypothetical protein [Oscillospiraceae bacterium]